MRRSKIFCKRIDMTAKEGTIKPPPSKVVQSGAQDDSL